MKNLTEDDDLQFYTIGQQEWSIFRVLSCIATSYLYMFESENVSTLCESTWISVDKMMVT
jgi:hypothetical protein